MNKTVFASIAALALTAGAFADSTVWYNGDFDGFNGVASEDNGAFNGWRVYDDFTWNSTSSLKSVFGTFQVQDSAPTSGLVEIRDGVSAGNGGTLVYSSTLALSVTSIGNFLGDDLETISANVGSVALTNGHTYWMTIAPNAAGDPFNGIFLATTSGANSIGSPVNDGNAFVVGPSQSLNFASADGHYGSGFHDFSYGVVANAAVPEPASLAVIGLGLLGVVLRRRRLPIA